MGATRPQAIFDFQPVLEGPSVTIRPLTADDWAELFTAASDPKIWEQHPASDRYTEPAFRTYFHGGLESGSAFVFVDRETGKLIGSSRYHGFDPDKSEIEIGWTFLSRDHWGGSYNAEIKKLMVEHALRFVDTVIFWVGEDNKRSRRAMEKIGGVLRPGTYYREMSGDSPQVIFEICRPRRSVGA